MASKLRLSALQMSSVPDVDANLATISEQLAELLESRNEQEDLVVLPECCLFFGGKDSDQLSLAEATKSSAEASFSIANDSVLRVSQLTEQLSSLARTYQVNLVAGTIPIFHSESGKFTNTSCFFNSQGELINQYDKIHLFDVDVQDQQKQYLESQYTQAGNRVVIQHHDCANVGLTVCYDLRFPELFRQLACLGADIITVPAAFTRVTGKAHWQALLQARAIENQVYIVAAGQVGIHKNGRETWGHSMIINPWGEVVTELRDDIGVISANFDLDSLQQIRRAIPVAKHNKFKSELAIYE